jgi:ferredoxin, 2Fe-2S
MTNGGAHSPTEIGDQGNCPIVRVEPSGALIKVRKGETLMAAAERSGYRWPTVCHGQAICTACSIVLEDNVEAFEPADQVELNGLSLLHGRSFYEGKVARLACQTRVVAPTVVTKRGVRPAPSAEAMP